MNPLSDWQRTLRQNDNEVAKSTLASTETPQGRSNVEKPKDTWKRSLGRERELTTTNNA